MEFIGISKNGSELFFPDSDGIFRVSNREEFKILIRSKQNERLGVVATQGDKTLCERMLPAFGQVFIRCLWDNDDPMVQEQIKLRFEFRHELESHETSADSARAPTREKEIERLQEIIRQLRREISEKAPEWGAAAEGGGGKAGKKRERDEDASVPAHRVKRYEVFEFSVQDADPIPPLTSLYIP